MQGAQMSYDPDCPERMKRKAARKLAQKKRKQVKQMEETGVVGGRKRGRRQKTITEYHQYQLSSRLDDEDDESDSDDDFDGTDESPPVYGQIKKVSESSSWQDVEEDAEEPALDDMFGSDSSDSDSDFEGFGPSDIFSTPTKSEVEQPQQPSSSGRKIPPLKVKLKRSSKTTLSKPNNVEYGNWSRSSDEEGSNDHDDDEDSEDESEEEEIDYYKYKKKPDQSAIDEDNAAAQAVANELMSESSSTAWDETIHQPRATSYSATPHHHITPPQHKKKVPQQQQQSRRTSSRKPVPIHRADMVTNEDSSSNLDIDSVVDDSSNQTAPITAQLTEEQHLAERASHARNMAKSVKSTDFKKQQRSQRKFFEQERPSKPDGRKTAGRGRKAQTGYMLWSCKHRKQVSQRFPGLSFGEVSKKLGDMWKRLNDKEKEEWKFQSENRGEMEFDPETTTKRKLGSRMIETGPPKKKPTPVKQHHQHHSKQSNSGEQAANVKSFGLAPPHRNPEQQMQRELAKLPPPSIQPIDAAAHIHIMGDSLVRTGAQIINNGEYDTGEVLNNVLDGLLCTIAPLLTLTKQVTGLQGTIPDKSLSETYANIAHLMPHDV